MLSRNGGGSQNRDTAIGEYPGGDYEYLIIRSQNDVVRISELSKMGVYCQWLSMYQVLKGLYERFA